jgi:hypothetical protein
VIDCCDNSNGGASCGKDKKKDPKYMKLKVLKIAVCNCGQPKLAGVCKISRQG